MHPTLQLLLANVKREGRTPLLGEDFNACIGPAEDRDYIDLVGPCGMGSRNQQGTQGKTPARSLEIFQPNTRRLPLPPVDWAMTWPFFMDFPFWIFFVGFRHLGFRRGGFGATVETCSGKKERGKKNCRNGLA